MNTPLMAANCPTLQRDDLIVIGGAGGFIGGSLARYFHDQGFTRIRGIDKKPLPEWYQRVPGVESLCMDLSEYANCVRACEGATEVYNLAADMGGMGFIEHFRVECLRSILINTHVIEAAYRAGAKRFFFSSSACAYNTTLQQDPNVRALKESDAYPAMAERGYCWEKLVSEMFCQEYWAERGLETHIARFHNVYGPCFDEATEVLTESGWKLFKEVASEDRIASLNPETQQLEYVKTVARQYYRYIGPMYHAAAQAIDQRVTPDHSVYAAFVTTRGMATRTISPFRLCKASESKWDRARMAFTSLCHWDRADSADAFILPECPMSDGRSLHRSRAIPKRLWFAFMGWYISEGSSFVTPPNYTVSISQKPGEKQDEIVALLTEMGFQPYVNDKDIIVSNKQLYECVQEAGQGAHQKHIPRWMLMSSAENLKILFATLMKGDGSQAQNHYSTVSRQLADDMMELCIKLGMHPVVHFENGAIYRVSISRRARLWTNRESRTVEPYDGVVYDVTLEKNHILMVRRNGKPVWSGNCGTWDGGREKAPAALCRKVITAIDTGSKEIPIWGDGTQTRSFMYIADCLKGIDMIMHCDDLIATPINLGSAELVSINELVSIIEGIAGVKLARRYDLTAPRGVAGRNSDNSFIKSVLGWEPNTTLHDGLAKTYAWIEQQYRDRKAGKRTVS